MAGKSVMIVDDDRAMVQCLRKRVESLGIDVIAANDGMTVLRTVAHRQPDLIILDVNMLMTNGLTVCAALAHDKSLPPVPVIILTGKSDPETIRRCEELGAHYLKKSTDVWERLRPLIGKLLGLPGLADDPLPYGGKNECEATQGTQVLIIDDDPDFCNLIELKLKKHGLNALKAFTGMQGYWTALKNRPEAIICDFVMPEGQGNYVLARLKSHMVTSAIPVIIVTARTVGGTKDFALERELLGLGASAFFTKPIDFDQFLAELAKTIKLPEEAPSPVRRQSVSHPQRIKR